jgi:hypothetical protein
MQSMVPSWRWLLALVFAVAAGRASAQTTTGTIQGVAKDASGGVLPGVTVTATNLGTGFTRNASSESDGSYALRLLPLGQYKVEAALQGFKTFVQSGLAVEVGRNVRVDPVLEIGGITEVVETIADAPIVDVATAQLGRTVTQEEVLNLPLVNRNVYSLLTLTAGVDRSETTNVFGYSGQATIVNGSPDAGGGSVNYYLDGGSNVGGLRNTGNVIPNPDAVQEFRVVTNSFSAEYGRFGGGAVDVITKSGTNAFHGSVFDFERDDALNEPRWIPGGSNVSKDAQKRHQFGATLGGPLKADKTFFFLAYQGLREEGSAFSRAAVVPTALERAGDFSQSRTRLNAATLAQFPNGIIPQSAWDPVARSIMEKDIPTSNLDDAGVARYEFEMADPLNTDEVQAKLDHTLSASHQLTASYFFARKDDLSPFLGNLPWSSQSFTSRQHNLNVGDNWVVSPSTFNTLRVTYVRMFGGRINAPEESLGDMGSTFNIQGPKARPQIGVTGYFTLGGAIFGPTAGSNLYMVRDVLSTSRGKHSIKFGGEFSLEKMIHDTTLNNYGVFTFDGSKTGNAFADFLTGRLLRFNQDAPITKADNVWYGSLFFQDDWRLSGRVTLNLGLRYDVQLPPTDPQDRKLTFVPGAQSTVAPTAPAGILFPGDQGPDGTIGRGIMHTDLNNISPRVGVAWDASGDGRTAIRAGFGIFYGSVAGNEWNQTADNLPFTTRSQFNNPGTLRDPYASPAFPNGSPFPIFYDKSNPRFVPPANLYGPSLDFHLPYSYQMNLSVQREVLKNLSVNVAYVGAMGRDYPISPDLNYPQRTANQTSTNIDARRPIQPGTLGRINLIQAIGGTDYHGVQATVEKRGKHLTIKGYYSFGKSLEDVALGDSVVSGSGTVTPAQNSTNLAAERAVAGTNRTHRAVASAIWKIDYFKSSNILFRTLFDNWTVSAIGRISSGGYITVVPGADTNLDGSGGDRANLVGDWKLPSNRSDDQKIGLGCAPATDANCGWFNTAAFARPANGTDGDSGRNIVQGPGSKNVDLGLFRDFKLGRASLQVRAEATNVFNIINWNNPNATMTSADFGKITGAGNMREIQLGAKLSF